MNDFLETHSRIISASREQEEGRTRPTRELFRQAASKRRVEQKPNSEVKQCLDNTTALRVQGSIALEPVGGNCNRKRWKEIDEAEAIESSPYQSEDVYERERVKGHLM